MSFTKKIGTLPPFLQVLGIFLFKAWLGTGTSYARTKWIFQIQMFILIHILVPRAHDPFGLRQGSRPLAGAEAGSPRITDFRVLCVASEI